MSLEARVIVRRDAFTLDVQLSCSAGETVAVLGPNGAGKTTLLRALAGLQALDDGIITIEGRDLGSSRDRRVGVVFSDQRLFPHLSARENVAFGPRAAGLSRAAARTRADLLLARLGLTGFETRRPRELSGGQAQRVALARTLAADPALLLLDEPLSALDAETRADTRRVLRDAVAEFGGPCVLVTHDPLEAMTLADRLVVLEGGRIVQEGAPTEVARRPATTYVARLVGLNLYRGQLADGMIEVGGGGRVACAAGGLGGAVLATLRPSAVTLSLERPRSSARNVWSGRVETVEVTGERVRVAVASVPPVVAEVTAASLAQLRIGAGDEVWASAKATDVEVTPV